MSSPGFPWKLNVTKGCAANVFLEKELQGKDFLGGPVVKNLPSNARDAGSSPGQGTESLTCLEASEPMHH